MKSIKPGRGPSAMGGFASVIIAVFGLIWIGVASNIGAPPFFALFGVLFVIMAIVQAVYHFRNASSKNRMSIVDIVDREDEPDPLDAYVLDKYDRPERPSDVQERERPDDVPEPSAATVNTVNYCPFCGNKILDESFRFCTRCGQQLRKS